MTNKDSPSQPTHREPDRTRDGRAPPGHATGNRDNGKVGPGGTSTEPQATSSQKEPGPRTLASSFPSAVGSTKPKTAQSGEP